jgi:hypothetical protein
VAPTILISLKQPSPRFQLSDSAPEIAKWKYRLAFAAIASPDETIIKFFERHHRLLRLGKSASAALTLLRLASSTGGPRVSLGKCG